jgi:hypothetical protein
MEQNRGKGKWKIFKNMHQTKLVNKYYKGFTDFSLALEELMRACPMFWERDVPKRPPARLFRSRKKSFPEPPFSVICKHV